MSKLQEQSLAGAGRPAGRSADLSAHLDPLQRPEMAEKSTDIPSLNHQPNQKE
jgi:hypothetical protein